MKILVSILILLVLVLQYQLWVGKGSLAEVWRLQQTIEKQRAENEEFRQRNSALEAEVQDLKKGVDAIEERARRELGMIKEDETFYQVIEDE